MGARGQIQIDGKRTQGQNITLANKTFLPDSSMKDEAKKVWRQVTACFPSDYFKEADRSLMESYCNLTVACRKIEREVVLIFGPTDEDIEKFKDWKKIFSFWYERYEKWVGLRLSLAVRLRISQSTRLSAHRAKTAVKNAYGSSMAQNELASLCGEILNG
jgi:hypothetical protein